MRHVIDRAGWRGKVEDVVDLAEVERVADVVQFEVEARLALQMLQIAHSARQQVVHGNHFVAIGQQGVAQVRAKKARPTRHQNPHHYFLSLAVCLKGGQYLWRVKVASLTICQLT